MFRYYLEFKFESLAAYCTDVCGWSWPPTDGNFMLVDVGSVALAGALYAGLKEAGILVRYWASRPDLNSKLRITVGAKESNEKFIALTRKLLAELKK